MAVGAFLGGLLLGTPGAGAAASDLDETAAEARVDLAQADPMDFDIPAQRLSDALIAFGRQAGLQVSTETTVAGDIQASGVSGTMSAADALQRLLAGTGLSYRFAGSLVVIEQPAPEVSDAGAVALDPIVVVGRDGGDGTAGGTGKGFRGAPDWIYETPRNVSVVTRQAIDETPPRNTSDVLQDVPGVWTSGSRQNPGVAVSIRGMQDMGRVNVTVDGARQSYSESGHGSSSRAYVDPALLGGVEVEKGPTSGVGGAGVIAGTVKFRTLEAQDILNPDETWGGRVTTKTGSNRNYFIGSTAAAGRVAGVAEMTAAVSRKKLGAYRVGKNGTLPIQDATPSSDLPKSLTYQKQWSGLLKGKAYLSDSTTLQLGYVGYEADFGTADGEYDDDNSVTARTATARMDWTPESPWIDLDGGLWYTSTENSQFRPERPGLYGAFDNTYQIDTIGGDATNVSSFHVPDTEIDVALSYGGEYFQDTSSPESDGLGTGNPAWFTGSNPEGDRDVAGVFTEATLSYDDWLQAIVGLRYDHYSLTGSGSYTNVDGDPEAFSVDNTDSAVSPKVTLAITPVKGVQVYGTWARGFRPPQLTETLLQGNHVGTSGVGMGFAYHPNGNLKAERSTTRELGLTVARDNLVTQGDGLRIRAAYFQNDVKNYIGLGQASATRIIPGLDPSRCPPLPPALCAAREDRVDYQSYVNLRDTTEFDGVELEASYDAGWAFGGVSWTRSDVDMSMVYDPWVLGTAPTAGEDRYNSGLSFIHAPPKQKVTVNLGTRLFDRAVTLGGRFLYVSRSEINSYDAENYPAYQVYGLYGSWAVNDAVTLRASVENLFDKRYVETLADNASLLAPGRTAVVALNVTF